MNDRADRCSTAMVRVVDLWRNSHEFCYGIWQVPLPENCNRGRNRRSLQKPGAGFDGAGSFAGFFLAGAGALSARSGGSFIVASETPIDF